MQLTDVQKEAVGKWVREGLSLSDVQKRLSTEFSISMTYMDVRFLILDLGLAVKEKAPAPAKGVGPVAPAESGPAVAGNSGPAKAGGVSVQTDRVTRPGAIVSGSVTFSDGVSGTWLLDQHGRLALNMSKPGYSPSEDDVLSFQSALKAQLEKMGF